MRRCAREYEWSANIGRPIMRGQFSSPRPGFFLSHRILAVQTSRLRSLRRYFQSTGHRGTARKLERKPRSVLADARPASPSLPPEGSETWLTGTLPPPPATPPLPLPSSSWWRFHPDGSRWTIVRSSPQRKEKRVPATLSPSLSLSLSRPVSIRELGEKAFTIAVGTKLRSADRTKEKQRADDRAESRARKNSARFPRAGRIGSRPNTNDRLERTCTRQKFFSFPPPLPRADSEPGVDSLCHFAEAGAAFPLLVTCRVTPRYPGDHLPGQASAIRSLGSPNQVPREKKRRRSIDRQV